MNHPKAHKEPNSLSKLKLALKASDTRALTISLLRAYEKKKADRACFQLKALKVVIFGKGGWCGTQAATVGLSTVSPAG